MARSCLSVCLLLRILKEKRLELSTPNLVHIYSIVVTRHALTQRSKGHRSRSHGYEYRHGRTVASDACCYGRELLLLAWVCMSIRLPMCSSYYYISKRNQSQPRYHMMCYNLRQKDLLVSSYSVPESDAKIQSAFNCDISYTN